MEKQNTPQKSWLAAFLLCTFLGGIGIHRFYLNKVGTGLLMMFTFGMLGIWTLIDWFVILFGAMRDKEGRPLRK